MREEGRYEAGAYSDSGPPILRMGIRPAARRGGRRGQGERVGRGSHLLELKTPHAFALIVTSSSLH